MKGILLFAFLFSFSIFSNEYDAVPGEYIVKLKNENFLTQRNAGIEVKRDFKALGSHFAIIKSAQSLRTLKSTLKNVEYVEPNFIYKMIGERQGQLTDDPDSGLLWGLENTGKNEPLRDGGTKNGVAGVDIKAKAAWAITKGSKDIVVAVIDTGIDYNHEDLKANIWKNEAELNGKPDVDDDGNGYVDDIYGYDFKNDDADPMDDHGHGTHCAGTIGAVHDNKIGVAGVMANVKLMALKFLAEDGGTTEGAIRSVDYARKMGADIMSNSWGGGPYSQALNDAITKANEAGIIFTAAAGNSKNNNDISSYYPAGYEIDNVISVAAGNAQGELATFTSFGRKTVDILAPGRNILSTVLDNKYEVYSGTSMATPHVSGMIGLYLTKHGKTDPKKIKEQLINSSKYVANFKKKLRAKGHVDTVRFLLNQEGENQPERPDPKAWKADASQAFETNHPYESKTDISKSFNVAGAKFIRAVFEKFDSEKRYDTLTIKDAQGEVVEVISGKQIDGYTTDYADGNTLDMNFKSDASVERHGFKLREIQYILE